MKFTMPPLPYSLDDLEPSISKKSLDLHYSGHLKGYINKLNQLPQVANSEKMKLEEFIIEGKKSFERDLTGTLPPGNHSSTLYNMSAQVYNHVFFFRSLSPSGGGEPKGDFKDIVDGQYGSWDKFKKKLIAKGKSIFGSGWLWICLDDEGELGILKGIGAETPIVYRGMSPILCIDVWEHAYYLDYTLNRGEYLESVIENIINWDFANKNLSEA